MIFSWVITITIERSKIKKQILIFIFLKDIIDFNDSNVVNQGYRISLRLFILFTEGSVLRMFHPEML